MQTDTFTKLELRRHQSMDACQALRALCNNRHGIDFKEISALESRIALCNSPANTVIIRDAHNRVTGELFDTYARYWRCNSKLCADCVVRQSRIHRKKALELFKSRPITRGERTYFVTFTIPNPNLAFKLTRQLVARAWELFRKRKFCVASLKAGIKSEEFTVTKNGFHYHLHCLFITKGWISYRIIRELWTDCVEAAFRENDIKFEVATADKLLWVVLKPIHNVASAVQEVCKYITKGDSWTKLPPSVLYEIALIRRYNRMFEAFGDFRSRQTSVDDSRSEQSSAKADIVHTRSLSDALSASTSKYWRDRVASMTLDKYREQLVDEFHRTVSARTKHFEHHFPYATFEDYT